MQAVINSYAAARNRVRDCSREAAIGVMKTDVISRSLKLEVKRLGFKPLRQLRFYFAPFAFFAAILLFGAAKVLLVASAATSRKM